MQLLSFSHFEIFHQKLSEWANSKKEGREPKNEQDVKGHLAHSLVAAQGGAVHQTKEWGDAKRPSHENGVVFLRAQFAISV
ncbi:hypothetical protein QEN58_01085 [Halomonas alkaliantarctica]|uniref:Uncharacterized protein n=1 Tax=Halomonas alkaliantarctica TaxID=232346 RepID=A0ABY8LML2_9GAMM|nr:hypothetical protein [Halomonas alkaliantarctica]WGI25680.1 hypothetical protein QEN58_01085 [Halomonas alkaliantarctica]